MGKAQNAKKVGVMFLKNITVYLKARKVVGKSDSLMQANHKIIVTILLEEIQ